MTTKGVILEQPAPSTSHVEPDGGGSNPEVGPETEAEKTVWQNSSPWVHGLLGVASFVPGLSIVTGAADAAIYTGTAEGEFVEAGIAAASMIPGGKVVTTAGKAAKGVVAMAAGAGMAAKIAKGTHEAEGLLKAAKAAREAKAAKEAREAEEAADEARQAASGINKPKKEVTVKAREHNVPCFHPYDNRKFIQMGKAERKAYLKEMAAQLNRQQEAINSLTANEYKAARGAFIAMKRNPAAADIQARFRQKTLENIKESIGASLMRGGMNASKAEVQAEIRARTLMDQLAALHDPDMVAGGWMRQKPTRMGRADVNSSIGGSWNQIDRVSGMDRDADRIIESGRGDQKMNVKLEPCRGRGMR